MWGTRSDLPPGRRRTANVLQEAREEINHAQTREPSLRQTQSNREIHTAVEGRHTQSSKHQRASTTPPRKSTRGAPRKSTSSSSLKQLAGAKNDEVFAKVGILPADRRANEQLE